MSKKTNVILRETKNLMRSFTNVQDDNQAGRSMVEMLGVLAIVGVLSVGGITGYTSAMRQYRANEIVNATSMLYMIGSSQNQGAGDKQMLYSAALGTVPSGATEITYNADKTITIAITDEDICTQVKNKLGDKAGECTAAASGYTLTVTFGEVSETTSVENACTNTTPLCINGTFYDCSDYSEEHLYDESWTPINTGLTCECRSGNLWIDEGSGFSENGYPC